MANKENDWFLAVVENPEFQISNFMQVGLTPENTQLKDKNFYQNSLYIQSLYLKDGKFDLASFDLAYSYAALKFLDFSNNSFKNQLLSDYLYDPYDSTRPLGANVRKPNIVVEKIPNPLQQIIGFGGIGNISSPTITVAEAAQQSKVFDWEKLEFTDYTPNDLSLEKSVIKYFKSFAEPLVVAKWDEDGTHVDSLTGQKRNHKKGDLKTNSDGDYYYETLGKRSPYGREIKSVFDTITIDGSKLNTYDFFDADSLDKSTTGTIAKTLTAIAPIFTPLAPYYGYAMIGTQLMDLLPTLYNSVAGIFTDSTVPTFNTILGIGRSLRGGTSQYSKENLLTFENFANTIVDVALLWQQQRTLFDTYHKLSGTSTLVKQAEQEALLLKPLTFSEKTSEALGTQINIARNVVANNKLKPLLDARNRTAANASLGYMAALLAFDVYEDVLEQGATKTEAAAMAWGAALGMYVVDRTGLGELFFPELQSDARSYRNAINKLRDSIASSYATIGSIEKGTRKGLFKLMDKARNASSNYWQNVKEHSLGFIGKTLGEGIEEVSEELVVDFTKSTYNLMFDLGLTNGKNKLDAWENADKRYFMNFFGGAVGGAIFYGADVIQGRINNQTDQELIYLLRNNKKQELLDTVQKMLLSGKLGSTTLSASKIDPSGDSIKWLTAEDRADSQNDMIGKQITDVILSIDGALHQEKLDFSDPEIIDKLVMSDMRLLSIIDAVGESGTKLRALRDFNKLSSKIVSLVDAINTLSKLTDDNVESVTRSNKAEHSLFEKQLSELLQELNDLRKQREEFFSENASAKFLDKLLFEIDKAVNTPFYASTFDQYVEATTHMNVDDLSDEQKNKLLEQFLKIKLSEIDEQFDMAYAVFEYFNKKYTDTVNKAGESYREFLKVRNILWNDLVNILETTAKILAGLLGTIEDIQNFFAYHPDTQLALNLPYDTKIDIQLEDGESDEDFESRIDTVYAQHIQERYQKLNELIDKFAEIGFIDSDSKKLIEQSLETIALRKISDIDGAYSSEVLQINNLAEDIKNEDITNLYDKAITEIFNKINNEIDKLDGFNTENVKTAILSILDSFKEGLNEDDEELEDKINDTKNELVLDGGIVDQIVSKILQTEQYRTVYNLKTKLTNIKQNPVIIFLLNIHTEVSGRKSNVIEILNEYNAKLEKSNFEDFELDSVLISEIDTALQAILITRALINAASSQKLEVNHLYGHNAVYNDFIKDFKNISEYGIVESDLATMMLLDLSMIEKQLEFLKRLNSMNLANTLNALRKTGQTLNKLLFPIFKPHANYENLKESILVSGIQLFAGTENINTSELEELETNKDSNKLGQIEIDLLVNVIANNYQEILKNSGKKVHEVNEELVEQIIKQFNLSSLVEGNAGEITLNSEYLTQLTAAFSIIAAASLSKLEFNEIYLGIIDELGIIPIPALEHIIFIAAAFAKNSELFNKFIEKLPVKDRVKLFNTFIINGIGGAGKTTILKVVEKFINKYSNSNKNEIWAIAPGNTLLNQLEEALLKTSRQLTIEDLLKELLSEEDYNLYREILAGDTKSKKWFKYDIENKVFEIITSGTDGLKFNKEKLKKLKSLIIDECTHVNTLAAVILQLAATTNDFLIFDSGDSYQNGFMSPTDLKYRFENINKETAVAVRTPKLTVSMRSLTIWKKLNNDFLTCLAQIFDKKLKDVNLDDFNTLLLNKSLKYYEGDLSPLSGEKLVASLDITKVKQILESKNIKGEPVKLIYIYDDESSKNYNSLKQLESEFKGQVRLLKTNEVLGLEAEYTIIDIDFSKYNLSNDDINTLYSAVTLLYTVLTRSKIGTILLDRGISEVFPNLRFQKEDYIDFTPNLLEKLKDLVDERKRLLQESIALNKIKPVVVTPKPVIKISGNNLDDLKQAIQEALNSINSITTGKQMFDNIKQQLEDMNDLLNDPNITQDAIENIANEMTKMVDNLNQLQSIIQNNITQTNSLIFRINDLKTILTDDFIIFIDDTNLVNVWKLTLENYLILLNNFLITGEKPQDDLINNINTLETTINNRFEEYKNRKFEVKKEDYINDDDEKLTNEQELDLSDRSIRVWGFYDRIGNANEDYTLFINTINQGDESEIGYASIIYSWVKNAFGYSKNKEELIKYLKAISNETTLNSSKYRKLKSLIDNIIKSLEDTSGQFFGVISEYNATTDLPASEQARIKFKPQEYISRIVYQFNINGLNLRITIGALTDPENWEKKVKPEDKLKADSYFKFISEYRNKISNSNPEITFSVNFEGGTAFTNLERLDGYYNWDERTDKNSNLAYSKVFVSAEETFNPDPNPEKYSHKGRPIVFATPFPFYINDDGNVIKINEDSLKSNYIDFKETKARGAVIRKVCLHANAQNFVNFGKDGDSNKISGLLDVNFDDYAEEDSSKISKILSTMTTNNTGIRIFIALWNWRANLKNNEQSLRDGKLCDLKLFGKKDGIMMIDSTITEPVIIFGNSLKFKNIEIVESWIALLDNIFNLLSEVYDCKFNGLSENSIIELRNSEYNRLKDIFAGTGSTFKIYVKTSNGKESEQTLSKDRPYLLITLLSKMYQYLIREDSSWVFPENNSGKRTAISETLADFLTKLDETSYKGNKIEAFTHFINITLLGNKNPYELDENQRNKTLLNSAMFPYGIFYHPKFETKSENDSGTPKEYYPISKFNKDSLFKCNVVILPANSYVSIPSMQIQDNGIRYSIPTKEEFLKAFGLSTSENLILNDIYEKVVKAVLENARTTMAECYNLGIVDSEQINKILSGQAVLNGKHRSVNSHFWYTVGNILYDRLKSNPLLLFNILGKNNILKSIKITYDGTIEIIGGNLIDNVPANEDGIDEMGLFFDENEGDIKCIVLNIDREYISDNDKIIGLSFSVNYEIKNISKTDENFKIYLNRFINILRSDSRFKDLQLHEIDTLEEQNEISEELANDINNIIVNTITDSGEITDKDKFIVNMITVLNKCCL